MTEKQIRFWFDDFEKTLIVVHIKTGKRRFIQAEESMKQFLQAHGLTLADCMEMQEREDITNLFLMNPRGLT